MAMTIKDIIPGKGGIILTATVIEKQQAREFEKFGKMLKVSNATLQDKTGTITLSLWNDDIDKVKVGDTITISNGYASEFKGIVQLSTGKFGTLQVLTSNDDHGAHILTKDEEEESVILNDELDEPLVSEEITEDELLESDLIPPKKSAKLDNVDVEEERVE